MTLSQLLLKVLDKMDFSKVRKKPVFKKFKVELKKLISGQKAQRVVTLLASRNPDDLSAIFNGAAIRRIPSEV